MMLKDSASAVLLERPDCYQHTPVCGTSEVYAVQVGMKNRWLRMRRTSTLCEFAKRGFDIFASVILLVLLSPLLITVCVVIVLDSPGAPIFRQRRKGKSQSTFWIYKFRTMVPDAARLQVNLVSHNEANGILFKLRNDPRITQFGRFLRWYSIDELPQLFNVLKGDMSLVGPRPFALEDFSRKAVDDEVYERWNIRRHTLRPGLTGLWQVSGRNDLSFERLMEFDLRYVRYWNPFIDAIILLKTLGVVLNAKGAY